MNFSEKVVLVTGASSGIGEAVSVLLAELGARLILVARKPENLHRVAKKCHQSLGKVPLVVTADVTNENDIIRLEQEVNNNFGRLDILLNIVGGIIPETILKPDVEKFDRNIILNLRSVYMMISRFHPHLSKTKGNIVNITSIVSDIIIKGHCGYNISKAGVEYITKYAAAELAHEGVRVNCVKPGVTRTPVLEKMGFSREESDKMYDDIEKKMPLGKIIEPREVAHAIVFLASDLAKNVTGTIFTMDGGQILAGPSRIELNEDK